MSDITGIEKLEGAALEAKAAERPKADLKQLQEKAARLIAVEQELADMAETEKLLKKERESLRVYQIPEMMFELNLSLIGIGNKQIKIEDSISAVVPKDPERLKEVCDYLVDIKEGGGIRRRLEVQLPKGDAVMEQKVLSAIRKVSSLLDPTIQPSIHHQTYTSLCKRLIRSGRKVPKDLLGIFVGHVARVEET